MSRLQCCMHALDSGGDLVLVVPGGVVVFWASLEREKERKSEETGRTEASTSVLLHPQLSSTPHRRPRCPTLKLPPRLPTSLTTPWVPHRAGELSHGPVHLLTSSASSARSLAEWPTGSWEGSLASRPLPKACSTSSVHGVCSGSLQPVE